MVTRDLLAAFDIELEVSCSQWRDARHPLIGIAARGEGAQAVSFHLSPIPVAYLEQHMHELFTGCRDRWFRSCVLAYGLVESAGHAQHICEVVARRCALRVPCDGLFEESDPGWALILFE